MSNTYGLLNIYIHCRKKISSSFQSRQPKKQYTTTGKNYCDVCNKEVCNKYFLRTHMLKMHGIVIDEHKTIIANIDTLEKEKSGTIAFRYLLWVKFSN